MRILRHKGHLFHDRALLVPRTGGGLQRNQHSCHLRELAHDPPHHDALADKQDI
jgi:hypothetical protein